MVILKSLNMLAPGVAANILSVRNDGSIPVYAIVENLDTTSGLTVKWKETNDGVTFTDIIGSTVLINPVNSNGQIVPSNARTLVLEAQGNVRIDVHIVKNINGTPNYEI